MLTYADVCGRMLTYAAQRCKVQARLRQSIPRARQPPLLRRTPQGTHSLYLLYWYESTNTDAEGAAEMALRFTHFTCFTGTKVPILTQKALLQGAAEMALGFAVRLQPDSADFCNSLGANLQLDGRVSDALVWYTRAMLTYADVCDACLVYLVRVANCV